MAPLTIGLGYGAIKGVGALAKYWARPKRPTFGKTTLGQYLHKLSQTGKYSPVAMRNIMSGMGRTGGNIAQSTRTGVRGWLTSHGMGDSIAGARALATPGLQHGRTMSDAAERLETENELSKQMAEEALAREGTAWGEARRTEKAGSMQDFFGGLEGAATGGLGAYAGMQGTMMPDFSGMDEKGVLDWAYKQPDYEKAIMYLIRTGVLKGPVNTGSGIGGAGLGARYGSGGWGGING